jgi:hypothetical protein
MLQAIQLWIIHDLPTYEAISWLIAKGYQGCPICSTHTISRRSKVLSKNVYTCQHRRWLPQNHEFHKDLAAFYGVRKMGLPPPKVIIANIFREAELRAQWLVGGGHLVMNIQGLSYGHLYCL